MKKENFHLSQVHREKAGDFFIRSKNREAVLELKKSLKYNPKNYEAIILLGDVESEIGSLKKALSYYDRAIKLRPSYFDAYDSKANALLGEGKAKQAVSFAKKALKLGLKNRVEKKTLEMIYDVLISSLFESKEIEEAFSLLRKGYKKTHGTLLKSLYKRYEKQIRMVSERN